MHEIGPGAEEVAVLHADRRGAFLAGHDMRSRRRDQLGPLIDPMEHAVGHHGRKEEVGRLAGGGAVGVERLQRWHVARGQRPRHGARRRHASTGPRHSHHQLR